jgi:hypothetical protein
MYLVIHSYLLGMAASGSYAHFGSAAEHVCLPMDPDIGPVSTTPYVSALYGTEYEETSFGSSLQTRNDHEIHPPDFQNIPRSIRHSSEPVLESSSQMTHY